MADDKPSMLWKRMTAKQRDDAARAFWSDEESVAEQVEVLVAIARRINFRAKSVQALPLDRKVKHLTALGSLSEAVAARLLVTYHLACQRPMMSSFLDALGIAHDNGLITEEEVAPPDAAKLATATEQVRGSFPPEDVALYFATLRLQDPEAWGSLSA
ncbi:MAG: hypothetical protein U0Q12_06915 [Vicinamibacterales bacterium]